MIWTDLVICKSGYSYVNGTCKQPDANCSGWNSSLSRLYATYDTCTGADTGKTYYKETACMTGWCNACGDKPVEYYEGIEDDCFNSTNIYTINNKCMCPNRCGIPCLPDLPF